MDSSSHQLFRRALARIPGGVNSPVRAFRGVGGEPFFVREASGCRLHTVDGRELIDYVGTWGPAILGHAPGPVIEAVRRAAGGGLSFGVPHPMEVEMAERLAGWVPSLEKVRMVNSGTEATMSCIRLARGYTGRELVVKFEGCYHGHVDSLLVRAGSGALTLGQPDSAGVPAAFAALTLAIPFNDPVALEETFARHGERIAAVILEPVPANAGLYLPEPGFLETLRDLCARAGALLIFDEVMTGFRLARGGAQALWNIRPDLSAFGKVIGGGLPVGAFGGRAEVMDMLAPDGPVYQAGTLSGNPIALAAGLAQLDELEKRDGWRALEEKGALLEGLVRGVLERLGRPLAFHRIGSMFCLFFREGPVRNLQEAQGSDRQAYARYFHHCLDRGIYFAPSQFETGFLSLAHEPADLEQTAAAMESALRVLP